MCGLSSVDVVGACSGLRLEDSASQTMVDSQLARLADKAARYISQLEAKVRAYEAADQEMGDSPHTRYLAEQVEKHVAENDAPDMPDAEPWWGPEECAEWDLWQEERAGVSVESDGEEWDEDAQPPSDHLRLAAKMPSRPALPAPATGTHAAAPAAPDYERMNSTTHRKEYMKLATCFYISLPWLKN